MEINWENIKKIDLFTENLYEKIFKIQDIEEREKAEFQLIEKAKKEGCLTDVRKKYQDFKKKKLAEESFTANIDFGKNAPIQKMNAPGYYKDKYNCIRTFDKNLLVTSTLLEPVSILKNNETGEELIKCAFLGRGKWNTFIIKREVVANNGKVTSLANKGVDVTSESSRLLVSYIRCLINNNDIPENKSTSKMGWFANKFLPYDEGIEFDGEDAFKPAFESISSKGKFEDWKNEIGKLRVDNTILKIVMATSFASPLLHLLNRQSFITHLWGKTGGKKTVAGRIAMSIWGDSDRGKLMYKMDSTVNFYSRVAAFFNNLPCFFDELQTYKQSVNQLIMTLTEGIDRGKAKADGGIEKVKTWNNTFIFTGEDSASSYNSGGGTLNRLIEIYIEQDIVKDGMTVCNFLDSNYGTAGKVYIDYIKKIGIDKIRSIFKEKYSEIMSFNKTEEKQAINMAMILLADELACECIFKNEKPLKSVDVLKYMFTKDEIDNSERAYDTFLDECEINKSRFNVNSDSPYGEFWGTKDNYEITIISQQLRKILKEHDFNYKKTMNDWEQKGYIEKNSQGKYSTSLSRNGIKANYIIVKIKKED